MPSLFHLGLSDRTCRITPAYYRCSRSCDGRSPVLVGPFDTCPYAPIGEEYHAPMADEFDVDALVQRFQERAKAVRRRSMPPVEGPERKRFVDQARIDYMDYAMIGDAAATLVDGVLTLTIDLRPGTE
jgi:hypothetical protein